MQEPTLKEKLDFMRELKEMVDVIGEAKPALRDLVTTMQGQADGSDRAAWLKTLAKVSELDEDTVIGCLMIAVSSIASIRVAIKDTAMEKELRELLGWGEPESAAQES